MFHLNLPQIPVFYVRLLAIRDLDQTGKMAFMNSKFQQIDTANPFPFLFASKMLRIFLIYSLVSYGPQKVCNITKVFTANNTFACLI